MRVETNFIKNYLSRNHFSKGNESVLLVLSLCLLASFFYWSSSFNISDYLAASYTAAIENKEYWRLFTTSFVHADLQHLLSNSIMLSILTYLVSSFYGSFISVGLSFIVAMITNYLVIDIYGGNTTLVGASGVVYYLWGFWMVLYIFLQRQYSVKGRLLRMGAVFLILLVPTEYQPRTSYLAHYIGFGLGVITGSLYYFVHQIKLLKAEVWSVKEVSDDLTDLDMIALNYSDGSRYETPTWFI